MISKTPKLIVFLLAVLMLLGGISVMDSLYAQQRKKEEKKESFNRPAPTQPIKPTIPDVNRYQEDKVFLENADSLFRPPMDYEEKQIVKGSVVFRQGGMWMYCDSAYYFPERNSLDAFGHVEMRQGDTLFVYADKLFYDGGARKAILTAGPSRPEVTLKDPKVTLTTDSLDYDMNIEKGWYTRGGKLQDDINVLTSTYGEYSPGTKLARFEDNVVLVNTKDGYKMYTEELDYSTGTHIATIDTETRIEGANDTILTTAGRYNTQTDNAVLTARSTILHRDSSMNVVTLEGDSIIYDKATRLSRAYMFRDHAKNPQPMVLTDTARKMTLIGGYGEYNDSLRRAFSTEYPLLMEYSQKDTLFLRADTILTSIRVEYVWPDSLAKALSAETRARLQSYTTPQEIADDMTIEMLGVPSGFPKPGQMAKLLGFNDSFFKQLEDLKKEQTKVSPSQPESNRPALAAEQSELKKEDDLLKISADETEIVQLPEKRVKDRIPHLQETPGEKKEESVESEKGLEPVSGAEKIITDSVSVVDKIEITDSVVKVDSIVETEIVDTVPAGPRLDKLGRDSTYMVPKDYHVARAIGRARFFRQDLQGVADTMIYQEYDSMLYLIRKPIVWSDQKQVYGEKINVHFNDSTVDRADLPEKGFMAEYIDEDFYNQLSGKKMTAYFENDELRRLEVEGNVETIFLPMENDSTYNKLVNVESSFLTIDMKDRTLDKLKFWPETTGSIYPLFLVKRAQQYLQGFQWFEPLRPKREWYGDRWKWIDELGEVPEELDKYFKDDTPASKMKMQSPQ